MADPFVAEIRIFPFNFAPTGWATCDGQLLPLSQNTALFALLGTTYGGDGKSTFALPNLQGNAPMHPGQGQGLSLRDLGETSGAESITLLLTEIPLHSHVANGSDEDDDSTLPANHAYGKLSVAYAPVAGSPLGAMAFQSLAVSGGSLPHSNMQPYLTLNFCIALQGVFPQRP
jgi:microcystin-dependent protein